MLPSRPLAFSRPAAPLARAIVRLRGLALIVALLVAASPALARPLAAAAAPAPRLAACQPGEQGHETVLAAAPAQAGAAHARALWIDRATLRWPGQAEPAAGERFRLLHSARGQVQARVGEPARGADGALPLRPGKVLISY